jgi:ATP-dependent HslUV protease ATP-binding subunit HslU
MYDIPDLIKPDTKVRITKDLVIERLGAMVKNRDLSQYIL